MQVENLQLLAERIYQSGDARLKQEAEAEALRFIGAEENLPAVLDAMGRGKSVMLLIGSVLLQLIRKGDYLKRLAGMIEEVATHQPDRQALLQQQIQSLKHMTYWRAVERCCGLLAASQGLEQYLRNTLVQLAAACLRQLFHAPIDIVFLRKFLQLAFQSFQLNPAFEEEHPQAPVIVTPRAVLRSDQLPTSLAILVSLMDDLLQFGSYQSYYEMRRTTNLFKVGFLPLVLETTIYHFKMLLMWVDQQVVRFSQAAPEILQCLRLFELILNYPFTLAMNDFEAEPQAKDYGNGEIPFPDYFRNITGDDELLQKLLLLHKAISEGALPATEHSGDILRLIMAGMGRLAGTTFYHFNRHNERQHFRSTIIDTLCAFLQGYNFYDQSYTNTLIGYAQRVLVSYQTVDYEKKFKQLSEATLEFCRRVTASYPLQIDYLEVNVISRSFELLKKLEASIPTYYFIEEEDDGVADLRKTLFGVNYRAILQCYLQRLSDVPALVKLVSEKRFRTFRKEIDCFKEMFTPVCFLFDRDFDRNAEALASTNLQQYPQEVQLVLMHFCTRMLFESDRPAITIPCQPVKKFYRWVHSKTQLQVSDMEFLSEFMENLLAEVEGGESASGLWIRVRASEDFYSFPEIIEQCITRSLQNFGCSSEFLLDCSLELLKKIYCGLQKHNRVSSDPNIQSYNQLFINFLEGLENTVFAKPQFFKKRIPLFEMISVIWLENGQPKDAYNFHRRIQSTFLQQMHPNSFLKYIYDCTGLVGEISEPAMHRLLLDLIVADLPTIFSNCLGADKNNDVYAPIKKALLRLFQALLKDTNLRLTRSTNVNTPIPLQLELLWPVVEEYSKHPYSKRLLIVWKALAEINKIRILPSLPPLDNLSKQKHKDHYDRLVRCYLDSMLRADNLIELYPHIHEHLETMYEWWEAAIDKNIEPPAEDFSNFVEARLWKTPNQKRLTAKILYLAGNYRPQFRVLPHLFEACPDEQTFVVRFLEHTSSNAF